MPLPRFDYVAARRLAEALAAWSDSPGAAFYAGGTDLLPQMRSGKRQLRRLIDIKRLPELGGIREMDDGGVAVGAAVPLRAIESHPSILARFPLLARCSAAVGAPQLRNRATLAGNICNASPAADTAVALLALGASITAVSAAGARHISIDSFFLSPGRTALAEGEIVSEIVVPGTAAGLRGSYLRLSRRGGMDLATIGVLVGRNRNGASPGYRVVLAAVAPTPLRVWDAEALLDLEGCSAAPRAAVVARLACAPISDVRGSAEYRREMVEVLTRRGIEALAQDGEATCAG